MELLVDNLLDDDELLKLLIETEESSGGTEESEAFGQEFNQTKLRELLENMGDLAFDADLEVERALQFRADVQRVMIRYNQKENEDSWTIEFFFLSSYTEFRAKEKFPSIFIILYYTSIKFK